jgi:hypothetical protein
MGFPALAISSESPRLLDGHEIDCAMLVSPSMANFPRMPDLDAQRAAMKKLDFLIGNWSGEVKLLRSPGEPTELLQTEKAEYKLDGLILLIEGSGRSKSTHQLVIQAFGVLSYDDEFSVYHLRAFNDGRFLESEVKLLEDANGMTWGFTLGEIKTHSILRINDKGEWTELAEITLGAQPPRKLLELTVRRQP